MSGAVLFLALLGAPELPLEPADTAAPDTQQPAAQDVAVPADAAPSEDAQSPADAAPSEAVAPAAEEVAAPIEGPVVLDTSATEEQGPPYYGEDDIDALRERYGIAEDPRVEPRKPKWRCLVPDPVCGFSIELSATSAFAYRTRQGNIAIGGSFFEWNSARVAYDVWFNFPAHVQTVGTYKFTRLTLGPKLAVVGSDNQDLWANMGIALRYWFGVGKWSPALEFTSALSFKIAGLEDDLFETQRSPIGLSADIGLNVGGWGAIIVGGQYDSPLAREEIPEKFRVSAAGQVFVGFRGNILWGVPAAAAVATHVAISRTAPPQP